MDLIDSPCARARTRMFSQSCKEMTPKDASFVAFCVDTQSFGRGVRYSVMGVNSCFRQGGQLVATVSKRLNRCKPYRICRNKRAAARPTIGVRAFEASIGGMRRKFAYNSARRVNSSSASIKSELYKRAIACTIGRVDSGKRCLGLPLRAEP